MDKIFDVYDAIGEDPEVGTNRIARMYNANRPEGTVECTESRLYNVVERANDEIQNGQHHHDRNVGLQTMLHKLFKHLHTWKKVRHLSKWKGDI